MIGPCLRVLVRGAVRDASTTSRPQLKRRGVSLRVASGCVALWLSVAGMAMGATLAPDGPAPGAWPRDAEAVVGLHINGEAFARAGLGDVQLDTSLGWNTHRAASAYRFAAFVARVDGEGPRFDLPLLAAAAHQQFGAVARLRLELPSGAIAWNGPGPSGGGASPLVIEVEPGDPQRLRVRDAAGRAWFALSHPHRWHDAATARTSLRNMDLLLHADAAARMGKPELAGTALGGVDFWIADPAIARTAGASAPTGSPQCNPQVWPSAATPADVALTSVRNVTALRCRDCVDGGSDGAVVIAPAAELRNVGAADIAWYPKLSGDFAPYGNDQHPFLVWNLYRLDPGGSLRQIGASGVKHAFFANNDDCLCSPALVLYRGCRDVYSAFTNDSLDDIGPRREVLPAPALWARCGSIYDANCDAIFDNGSGASDDYEFRLLAREADLLPALNPGARWFMEAWYVVRDDSNRDNSIAFREVLPQRTATAWSFATTGPERAGAVVDAWVAPGSLRPLVAATQATTSDGAFALAVNVRRIDGGRYRYTYVLTNIDTVRAETTGASPNLRLLAESGLASLGLPIAPGAAREMLSFNDGDESAGNDWTLANTPAELRWSAADNAATERWGRSYTFELTSDAAPSPGIATSTWGDPAQTPASQALGTLLPLDTSAGRLFADEFEGSSL